ncbi:MAG: type IVB secretion system protein IcmQ [Gammaproteobacteria bacterium]|nr:type IVB secretion system protein IcmQ [Gammaproteobacteria bacterium]MCW5583179.1 type IVB secretion system protein IcmQ [Gammaproteobacteria bacterium]
MSNGEKEQKERILQLVLDAIQRDKELRDQYQVADKFRFISDRLKAMQLRVEESLSTTQKEIEEKTSYLAEDEVWVYVYIYNAQGLVLQTWQKMLAPSVFYEYSVNRPVYADKTSIEAFVRSRPNKAQHGYLTIAIKKQDILPVPPGAESLKDQVGNPLVKIREGSLFFKKLVTFTHQSHEYVVNEAGQMIKKQDN